MNLRSPLKRPARRGQALVETAILLPVLLMLLLLAIDLGRVFFVTIDLRNAAHEVTMHGGTQPDALCPDVRPIVDRQMGRAAPDSAICGALGASTENVYITQASCEGGCVPWLPPYDANAQLRYAVRLEYRFQPVMPLVGFFTGNGMGGSVPIAVENRSPILVGYKGG
jgi:Flp pilus assembly protein TadG